jgi:hypothetical protein
MALHPQRRPRNQIQETQIHPLVQPGSQPPQISLTSLSSPAIPKPLSEEPFHHLPWPAPASPYKHARRIVLNTSISELSMVANATAVTTLVLALLLPLMVAAIWRVQGILAWPVVGRTD